ncbi:hypothetical protein AB0B78_24960 [Streptomyces sp. NPDC040724]
MRGGDWDNRFLNDYGNALVATEKKMKLPASIGTAASRRSRR